MLIRKIDLGNGTTLTNIDTEAEEGRRIIKKYGVDVNKVEQEQREAVAFENGKEEFKKILKNGKVSNDGVIWLNEELLIKFQAKIAATEALGKTILLWKNVDKQVIELTVEEAKAYMKEALAVIDTAYFGRTV